MILTLLPQFRISKFHNNYPHILTYSLGH